MKKTIYSAVLFLILGMTATSCKKEDKINTNSKESGISTIVNVHTSWLANRDFEDGYTFIVSKSGKILQLGARVEAGTYKVSLWDYDTKTKLDSINVTVTDSTQFSYASIAPRSVVANKKYVVSVHTTSGKYAFFMLNGTLTLPKTIGDITILDGRSSNIPTSGPFPEEYVSTDKVGGFADIIFQAD